jgi:4-hydroxy-tetrahydrodipicolinate reductase
MGLQVVRAVADAPDLELSAAIVRTESQWKGRDIGELAGVGQLGVKTGDELPPADVLIDFSRSSFLERFAPRCADAGVAIVSGTTALDEAALGALQAAADKVPMLWSANLSIGMQVLYALAEQAATALGDDLDIEIGEVHHRHKADAPSGTALDMGRRINRALGRAPEHGFVTGRTGINCRRQEGDIGFSSMRAGDVIGEHTVLMAIQGERLELTHRASTRQAFVGGALRAARWLTGRPPGQYHFAEVLGLPVRGQ